MLWFGAIDMKGHVRMIVYRREGNRVTPFRVTEENGEITACVLNWSEIKLSEVDPEFEIAWQSHVSIHNHNVAGIAVV